MEHVYSMKKSDLTIYGPFHGYVCSTAYVTQFQATLLFNFYPKLPNIHVGLHCSASEKTEREKGSSL